MVNAFVYDLKTKDILLLDRFHQAVSFENMVIAVQTQASGAVVDYSYVTGATCSLNGLHRIL